MWLNEIRKHRFLEFAVNQAEKGFLVRTFDYVSAGNTATTKFITSCRIDACRRGMAIVYQKVNNMLIVVYVKEVS